MSDGEMTSKENKKIWITSTNEEYWSCCEEYGSREEAVKHAKDDHDLELGDSFFVGVKEEYNFPEDNPRDFIEYIIESDQDSFGEWAESYIDDVLTNEELHNLLRPHFKKIAEIINNFDLPKFFLVKEYEQMTIEDVK